MSELLSLAKRKTRKRQVRLDADLLKDFRQPADQLGALTSWCTAFGWDAYTARAAWDSLLVQSLIIRYASGWVLTLEGRNRMEEKP